MSFARSLGRFCGALGRNVVHNASETKKAVQQLADSDLVERGRDHVRSAADGVVEGCRLVLDQVANALDKGTEMLEKR